MHLPRKNGKDNRISMKHGIKAPSYLDSFMTRSDSSCTAGQRSTKRHFKRIQRACVCARDEYSEKTIQRVRVTMGAKITKGGSELECVAADTRCRRFHRNSVFLQRRHLSPG